MKVLYVAGRWDPRDHNQASGIDYEIYHALLREGAEVSIVGPFKPGFTALEKLLIGAYRRLFGKRLFKYPFQYFFQAAREVNRAVQQVDHDLVVTKYSAPLVLARLEKPLLYLCDSSVKWIREQWSSFAWITYFTMGVWESVFMKKCDRIMTFSESNAAAIHEKYGIPEEKISYFAIPASIPMQKVPGEISPTANLTPLKILLVGRDYYRKGVDTAVDVVEELNRQGIPAELRVVGLDGDNSSLVTFLGLYDKTDPEQLEGYLDNYRWADFMIHPALFEAAGIVPSEAAAFGVPTVTNDTGGLATTVADGESGVVLPGGSPASEYVRVFKHYVEHPEEYQVLARSTKERYRRELNWEAAGKKVMDKAQDLLREDHPRVSQS